MWWTILALHIYRCFVVGSWSQKQWSELLKRKSIQGYQIPSSVGHAWQKKLLNITTVINATKNTTQCGCPSGWKRRWLVVVIWISLPWCAVRWVGMLMRSSKLSCIPVLDRKRNARSRCADLYSALPLTTSSKKVPFLPSFVYCPYVDIAYGLMSYFNLLHLLHCAGFEYIILLLKSWSFHIIASTWSWECWASYVLNWLKSC